MSVPLLPASAAAFAPRTCAQVVLAPNIEPWLTETLTRLRKSRYPLKSAQRHKQLLEEVLSGPEAIWSLCSIMVQKFTFLELHDDSDRQFEVPFNYQLIEIKAYVVVVDMILGNGVIFKLTPSTIDSLINYHKDICLANMANKSSERSTEKQQLEILQDGFSKAVNSYIYRAEPKVLEGLDEKGAGELPEACGEDVRNAFFNEFPQLLTPALSHGSDDFESALNIFYQSDASKTSQYKQNTHVRFFNEPFIEPCFS